METTLKRYINLLSDINDINDDVINVEDMMFVEYTFKPHTRSELIEIIHDRMLENQEAPYLLDIDTSEITDMRYLFSVFHWSCHLCYADANPRYVKKLDLSTWNTSNVETMYDLFWGCTKLEVIEGLQNWDLSKCKSFSSMFYNCKNLKNVDLSKFKKYSRRMMCSFNKANTSIIPDWYVY